MKNSIELLTLICLLVFGSACQSRLSPLPPIFSDHTCEHPCWANIIPGKTTEEEVWNILENTPSVQKDSIYRSPFQGFDGVFWSFLEGGEGYVLLNNGIVWLIYFSNSDPDKGVNVTLGQAIEKYGEPEYIFSAFNPDIPAWGSITFFYSEQGVDLVFSSHIEKTKYRSILRPETPISSITYYLPENYVEIFEIFYLDKPEWTEAEVKASIYPWKGYGNIAEKYPTAFKAIK